MNIKKLREVSEQLKTLASKTTDSKVSGELFEMREKVKSVIAEERNPVNY